MFGVVVFYIYMAAAIALHAYMMAAAPLTAGTGSEDCSPHCVPSPTALLQAVHSAAKSLLHIAHFNSCRHEQKILILPLQFKYKFP